MNKNLQSFDCNNKQHVKALNYFKITGHPFCKTGKYKSDDTDILLRKIVKQKFKLSKAFEDDCNGSTLIVVDENPNNFVIYHEFYYDDGKEFIKVFGKLMIENDQAIFLFKKDDIEKISEEEFNMTLRK